jgi:predicted nucleotidyltransferase
MKKLLVEMGELVYALEDTSWMANYYLDTETGQVVMVTDDIRRQLEDLYEQAYALDPESPPDLAALLEDEELPGLHGWQKDALLEADRVEQGYGSRYIGVPQGEPSEGYEDMEDFILTVQDERLQDRLWAAIRGRGAFRRFKDVLYAHPAEQERWYAYKERRLEERVIMWLAEEGIEPLPIEAAPDEHPVPQEPSPPVRSRLLAEALAFVRAACRLPGVLRIALIGSLATDKPEPKDVDLLVTVSDEADLAPLATLGRKLNGHCMAFRKAGDVFLADPRGRYLGRTCPWKECRPGIRISCDALHCGRRPYLHDDLQVVRLEEGLVRAPPIELWPERVARVPVPEDVEGELLCPLDE